jgi:hypothetical protein
MNSFVRQIGVIDKKSQVHAVHFGRGVNVVTGKSSTGKSALIEIFDYCFGSSEYTVPEGVITENANAYFVILSVNERDLVLARKPSSKHALIRLAEDWEHLREGVINPDFLEDEFFISLELFKKELAGYFGLDVTHVEEVAPGEFKKKKDAAPSVRSFTSFILQHQNLVANKHAIFYRFDEQEKREQVIRHLDIFLGFADQTYFLLSQELDGYVKEKKRLEFQLPKLAEITEAAEREIASLFDTFAAITGATEELGSAKKAVFSPAATLERISKIKIYIIPLSDEHAKQRQALEDKKALKVAALRTLHNEFRKIESSVQTAKLYTKEVVGTVVPATAEVAVSYCPFCKTEHLNVEHAANRLTHALEWLNGDLRKTEYQLESFEHAAQETTKGIRAIEVEIQEFDAQIGKLDQLIKEIEAHRNQYEMAIRAKARIEAALEHLIHRLDNRVSDALEGLEVKIQKLKAKLRDEYNLSDKRERATEYINSAMAKIGQKFDFEETYRPINLKFSLDTFELWHENKNNKKVFLRSMGSGANWLYSHLTLFLALHKYFCSLGVYCKMPSILFLDQPTQVYFPSVLDNKNEFSAKALTEKLQPKVDEDMHAVENMFDQLVIFCDETQKETNILPQIIVTDHADNLKLASVEFENLVNGRRWRGEGAGLINKSIVGT